MKHNGSKRNLWQDVQNFAEIPTVNLAKNFTSHHKSWRDSQQDRAKILAPVNFSSQRESWQDSQKDSGEILATGILASRRESW